MLVEVKKSFIDKYTNEVYKVGQKLNLEEKRIKEICKVGDFLKESDAAADKEEENIEEATSE